MVKSTIKWITDVIFGRECQEPSAMLAPLSHLKFEPIERPVYIFKLNSILRLEDARKVRQEIQRQLEDGVLLLDHSASFIGRKIEICGHSVTVEFINEIPQNGDVEIK